MSTSMPHSSAWREEKRMLDAAMVTFSTAVTAVMARSCRSTTRRQQPPEAIFSATLWMYIDEEEGNIKKLIMLYLSDHATEIVADGTF
jgi:hypothetical protein